MNSSAPPHVIAVVGDLGRAIRQRRKRDGLTLTDVAGLTKIGVRFLSELENGKPTVRFDKALQVAQALGLQLLWLDPDEPRP